eukprot:3689719-Pyramimonas_sp.AAC.1
MSALATSLPQPCAAQFACKRHVAVVHAVAAWLATNAKYGAELDLSKAYDNVDRGVAAAALLAQGVPDS